VTPAAIVTDVSHLFGVVGVANPAAGVFSNGTAGPAAVVLALVAVSVPLAGVLPARAAGLSTLPRMIGKPSLPLPMTTTFAFVDCESCSVASMPRQRR
jgi:hypothetical protein